MIDTSLVGENVTAGTNATADQYNALRADMGTGWVDPEITATYSAVSGQVGTITVPTDATTLFETGDKIRLKQGGAYKYFYVTAVTSTTLGISGGSEYTLVNAAITDFYMSKWKSPVDWPLANNIYITNTDGATVTFNLNASKLHYVQLAGNRTLALSNVKIGDIFMIVLQQDGTGSRTVTWFSGIKWADGATPVLATAASKYDIFTFLCIASGSYIGMPSGANAS